MEKNNLERVVAYQLSQEIKYDDMEQVSGGHSAGFTIERTNVSVMLNGMSTLQIDARTD